VEAVLAVLEAARQGAEVPAANWKLLIGSWRPEVGGWKFGKGVWPFPFVFGDFIVDLKVLLFGLAEKGLRYRLS